MVKITSVTIVGFLLMLAPFYGLPKDWIIIGAAIGGLAVLVLSIMIRKELHVVLKELHTPGSEKADVFVDSEMKK